MLNGRAISPSAIKLLAKRVWYRTLPRIRGIFSGGASPGTHRTAGLSPAARLPLEIVEMIIAHLIYETNDLLACSLTCYSWHTATVPHLHHTLIAQTHPRYAKKPMWHKALQNMHRLGLLPLVNKFQVHGGYTPDFVRFSPQQFNYRTLRCFSSTTNVRELGIDSLDTP